MTLMKLGVLNDDSTLPRVSCQVNLAIWREARDGNGVTSYHLWLLSRNNQRLKGCPSHENEKKSDLQQYAEWMGTAWILSRGDVEGLLLGKRYQEEPILSLV